MARGNSNEGGGDWGGGWLRPQPPLGKIRKVGRQMVVPFLSLALVVVVLRSFLFGFRLVFVYLSVCLFCFFFCFCLFLFVCLFVCLLACLFVCLFMCSVLFCFVLLCSVLFCFVLFCSVWSVCLFACCLFVCVSVLFCQLFGAVVTFSSLMLTHFSLLLSLSYVSLLVCLPVC